MYSLPNLMMVDEKEETIRAILNGDETPTRKRPPPPLTSCLTASSSSPVSSPSSCCAETKRKKDLWGKTIHLVKEAKSTLSSSSSTSSSSSGKIRPRKKHINDNSNDDDVHEKDQHNNTLSMIQTFKNSRHSLRLSSTSVAAMTGFHPYTNLAKLFMDLVYQGYIGQKLLQQDAQLLGIQLMSEQESLLQLAQKAGTDVLSAIQHSMNVSKGKIRVNNVQDANVLKKNIMDKVQKSSSLSIGERKILQEATRYNINTGFGKDHEEDALDLYEKQCGWEVTCRNEGFKYWKFHLDKDGNAVPMNHTTDDKQGHGTTSSDIEGKKPFFFIVGVADGIRDELYHVDNLHTSKENQNNNDNDDDDDDDDDTKQWALRQVVVECKHRMRKAFIPPPIYDQIQLVIYCMMYGTSEGEIVQVVKNNIHKKQPQQQDGNTTNNKNGATTNNTTSHITISRISLQEDENDTMQHRHNWYNTILPRLTSFVHAVYNVRANDDKRYRMIHAAAAAATGASASLGENNDECDWWQILLEECPWLKDCEIALFRNKNMTVS
mmetsp:Transcript_11455/g.21425  ORF Transcript_11455/g.21425 Transcript_11455/m.21425 type:complete len:548 (+) Transcript_11455:26-1669(+)